MERKGNDPHYRDHGLYLIVYVVVLDSFEPNAESQCEAYLAQAVQIEPVTPEVYQTLASVRLSQQRVDEAKAALAQGLAIWLGSDRKWRSLFV